MMLVFQDDGMVRVIGSAAEANREYEAADIESSAYTFLDDRGFVLRPVLREQAKKKWLFFSVADTVPFTFEATNQRRDDLLAQLRSGTAPIDPASIGIRSLDDLRSAAPALFIS